MRKLAAISARIFRLLPKVPRKIYNAFRYLRETGDINGLIAIFKRKIFNFVGPNPIWQCRAIVANIQKIVSPSETKVHFMTFYTQGGEFDDGMDLSKEANELARKTKPFVDSITLTSAYDLKKDPKTEIYVKEFTEEAIWNFKTNKIGFLRWKPYIILQKLKELNEGDIIFYRDCNITKYPNIIADIHNIRKNAIGVLNYIQQDIFSPIEMYPKLKVKNNVKIEVLKRLAILSEDNMDSYLHNASIIICRKNKNTIKFMEEWLEYCMDDELLSPKIEDIQHCELLHNTQEQAIMNGMLIKNGYTAHHEFDKPIGLSIVERLFSLNKLIKVPRVAVLYCGQVRNYDNFDLLEMNCKNILGLHNCDVFASVWDERGYSFHHGEASPSEYAYMKDVSQDKITSLLHHSGCNVREVEIENFDEWISTQEQNIIELYHEGLKFGDKVVKATAFPQLYKIYRANLLKSKFEKENNFKYDLVIRMRPDMGFIESIPDEVLNSELTLSNVSSKIYHLNPPKIYYPNRIYDIFFLGNSQNMDKICESWPNIQSLLRDPVDNGLPIVDCCRLLYVQALKNNLHVVDIPRCIGDIYRDEPIDEYRNKILNVFN